MKFAKLLLWDMRFQLKYGFYLLYGVLTGLYLLILSQMPLAWRQTAVVLLVFSDPAAMGLFFMGAILLLEKSQRVVNALAVAPITVTQYLWAKVISLEVLSLGVALVLGLTTSMPHLPRMLAGTALASALFTLLGVIAAAQIKSLNQFLLVTVPLELLCFGPALLQLYKIGPAFLRFYPPNACMSLIAGEAGPVWPSVLAVLVGIGLLFALAHSCVTRLWRELGGVKL